MINLRQLLMAAAFVATLIEAPFCQAAEKIRVLIMSGSHRYETNQFLQMFKDNPEVTFESVIHPHALEKLRPESAKRFDVLVMYDYAQKIGPEQQADFLNFLRAGKGLVILHHAIAAYPDWKGFERILGGKYYLQKSNYVNGVVKPRSRAKEGMRISVHVADPEHPVTRGVKDFEIQDETYFGYDVLPDSHILLSTTDTNNAPTLAWARQCEAARVVYLQLGHDHLAYEHPSYRKLVSQAVRWVTGKD